jgi:hypothetical protein
MRLIDADAIDTRYCDPEVVEVLEAAPTAEAIPKVKIDHAIKKMENMLQRYFNIVHCSSNYDELNGIEKALKWCIKIVEEACK